MSCSETVYVGNWSISVLFSPGSGYADFDVKDGQGNRVYQECWTLRDYCDYSFYTNNVFEIEKRVDRQQTFLPNELPFTVGTNARIDNNTFAVNDGYYAYSTNWTYTNSRIEDGEIMVNATYSIEEWSYSYGLY